MTPSDFPVTDSGHLFQSWLALEPYEQHMLLLLAVIYKPISVTKFNQVVKITTQYGFIDLPVSQQKLSPAVRDRLSDESLIAHSKEGLRINPAVANRLR